MNSIYPHINSTQVVYNNDGQYTEQKTIVHRPYSTQNTATLLAYYAGNQGTTPLHNILPVHYIRGLFDKRGRIRANSASCDGTRTICEWVQKQVAHAIDLSGEVLRKSGERTYTWKIHGAADTRRFASWLYDDCQEAYLSCDGYTPEQKKAQMGALFAEYSFCYLAGTINTSDDYFQKWRHATRKELAKYGVTCFVPLSGKEKLDPSNDGLTSNVPAETILKRDTNMVISSDVVLVNLILRGNSGIPVTRQPIGTFIEMGIALAHKIPIYIVIDPRDTIFNHHPFITACATEKFFTLPTAISAIRRIYGKKHAKN